MSYSSANELVLCNSSVSPAGDQEERVSSRANDGGEEEEAGERLAVSGER